MLVLITNKCHSGCTHCMQDSRPDGPVMDRSVFEKVLSLCEAWREEVLVISGGEPFEHPELFDFCRLVSKQGILFTVCSNGLWLGDEKKRWTLEKISKLRTFAGAQMYTNSKWYPHHEEALALWKTYGSWADSHGFHLDPHDIRGMLPLGRAASNKKALEEVEKSPYHMSCLKGHLMATQAESPRTFTHNMDFSGSFCKPVVDWFGDIRMSECVQCPVVSSVFKDPVQIWNDLKKSKPCYQCSLAKKFIREAEESPTSKIGLSYKILKGELTNA